MYLTLNFEWLDIIHFIVITVSCTLEQTIDNKKVTNHKQNNSLLLTTFNLWYCVPYVDAQFNFDYCGC